MTMINTNTPRLAAVDATATYTRDAVVAALGAEDPMAIWRRTTEALLSAAVTDGRHEVAQWLRVLLNRAIEPGGRVPKIVPARPAGRG